MNRKQFSGVPDRFEVYTWHEMLVEANVINRKADITVDVIHKEKNSEVKRVLIDLYGPSRYLFDAGARVVHQDERGKLFRIDIELDEPLVMVRVRNNTREPTAACVTNYDKGARRNSLDLRAFTRRISSRT